MIFNFNINNFLFNLKFLYKLLILILILVINISHENIYSCNDIYININTLYVNFKHLCLSMFININKKVNIEKIKVNNKKI